MLLSCLIKPHRGSAKDKDQNNFLFMNTILPEVLGGDACHDFSLSCNGSCPSYEKNASHTYQRATIQLLMQQAIHTALQPILSQSSHYEMGERTVWRGPQAFEQFVWATTCSSAMIRSLLGKKRAD